jgi:hypothetical protein
VPRTFNGSASVTCSIGNLGAFNFGTMLVVARRTDDAAWHGIVTTRQSGAGAYEAYMDIAPAGHATAGAIWSSWGGTDNAATLKFLSTDGWCIVAVTKATGSATPRYHKCVLSSRVWTHNDGGGAVANATSTPGGTVILGAVDTDALNGDLAAVALYARTFSDQEIESLLTWETWLSYSPVGAWLLDQAATGQTVVDWVDGANQSGITGTTVTTGSLPGWNQSDGGVWAAEVFAGGATVNGDAALTATAGVTAGAAAAANAAATLTGTATITAAAAVGAVSALTATAAVTPTGAVTANGAGTCSTTATVTPATAVSANAATALTGTAAVTPATAVTAAASATPTTTAAITPGAAVTANGAAPITVTATLTAAATVGAASSLTATASIAAAATPTRNADTTRSTTASFTAVATAALAAQATRTANAGLTATAATVPAGQAGLTATAAIAALADISGPFTVGALTATSTATSSLTASITRGGPA